MTRNEDEDVAIAPLQFYFKKANLVLLDNQIQAGETNAGYVATIATDPSTGANVANVQALFKDAIGNGRLSTSKRGCPYPPECLLAEGFINPNLTLNNFILTPNDK